MKRRDVLTLGGGVLAAKATASSLACATPAATSPAPTQPPMDDTSDAKALAQATTGCTLAGEQCLAHCIRRLSEGDTSMAACAKAVTDMLAVCRAVTALAAANSSHLQAAAALCVAVCTDCAAACEPHAGHHAECESCHQACLNAISVAKAFA